MRNALFAIWHTVVRLYVFTTRISSVSKQPLQKLFSIKHFLGKKEVKQCSLRMLMEYYRK